MRRGLRVVVCLIFPLGVKAAEIVVVEVSASVVDCAELKKSMQKTLSHLRKQFLQQRELMMYCWRLI